VVLVAAACPAFTQPLEDLRARQEVAAQALEAEVRELLKEADRLRTSDRTRALAFLRLAESKLQNDILLKEATRTALKTQVSERLRRMNAETKIDPKPPITPVRPPDTSDELKKEISTILRLRTLGEYGAAQKLAEDLWRKHPNSREVDDLRRSTSLAAQLKTSMNISDEKAVATAKVMQDTYKSAIPLTGEVSYPPAKEWQKKNQRAAKYAAGMVQFTQKEIDILKALNQVTANPVNMKGVPFEDVLKFLQQQLGQPISVDGEAMKELGINYESHVNAMLPKNITNRTLLRSVLSSIGMTYVVKNETILITSPTKAANELVTRYYQIDDLLGVNGMFTYGFNQQFAQEMQAQQLINLIKTLIDPTSWQPHGPGTIVYYAPTRTLIIKNTSEVINALGGGLLR
jgi:hypothetical protein